MHIIIIGCGRLGSGLARELSLKGNEVTVIDSDASRFAALGKKFSGKTVVGFCFDKGLLEEAMIERADALVSCTESDQVNALVARIARNVYSVPKVIARLYDPRKASIYQALGILTISTTSWGIQRAKEILSYSELDSVMEIGNSTAEMVRIEIPELLIGRPVRELSHIGEFHVVYIVRSNKAFLPVAETVLERNDILYIATTVASLPTLKSVLGLR